MCLLAWSGERDPQPISQRQSGSGRRDHKLSCDNRRLGGQPASATAREHVIDSSHRQHQRWCV